MQVKYHTCRQVEVLCHVLSMVLNPATYSFDLHDPVFFCLVRHGMVTGVCA